MKIVRESIEFQRGKDPRSSMEIGRKKDIVTDLMKIIISIRACKGVYLVDSTWPRYTKPFRLGDKTYWQLQFVGDSYAGFRTTFKSELNRKLKEFGFDKYLDFPGRDVGRRSKEHWIYYLVKEGYEDIFSDISGGITSFDARKAEREGLLESIRFERGKDPKSQMGIGIPSHIREKKRILGGDLIERGFREIPIGQNPYSSLSGGPGIEFVDWYAWTDDDDNYVLMYGYPNDGDTDVRIISGNWPKNFISKGTNDSPSDTTDEGWDKWWNSGWIENFPIMAIDESVRFERRRSPKETMGLGTVLVSGDRGNGSYRVLPLNRHYAPGIEDYEEIWKAEIVEPKDRAGDIVYVMKHDMGEGVYALDRETGEKLWGEIDAFITESINFERGKEPKDSMRIGRKYENDLEIDGVYTVMGTGPDLERYNPEYHHKLEGYDERKFFQNLGAGLFPSNLGVKMKGERTIIPSDRLENFGVEHLVYNDKIFRLG